MTTNKERPILFNGEMVRAILNGSKTQTRRVVKTAMDLELTDNSGFSYTDSKGKRWSCGRGGDNAGTMRNFTFSNCPYGKPGDRLWVREAFAYLGTNKRGPHVFRADTADGEQVRVDAPWKPSIHMPRWASRILLEIVSVRIERLQDISRGDAMDEGCPFPNMEKGPDPRLWYAELWDQINGQGQWLLNPWVWVVEFKQVEQKP